MFSTDRWSRDVCLERVRPSSLCKWRLCQNVAIAILKTTGYHTKYVDIPVGSTLNHRTRGVNLFLRLEEASDHKDLVYALNQYFFHRGWETWATHARTTVPFTAQPTWMSGDRECDCRNCWHERPLAEPPATPAPMLTAPPATPALPTTTPTPVRAERGALRGVTRWDTRHTPPLNPVDAPPLGNPVDAPTRIVHVVRGSNPRWVNATYRRDTRIVIREPPETKPYWPGRVRMQRASPNPSSHYN